MSFSFRPASSFTERHGLFVALVGGTNSGKTFSALRLARGIAGPKGKIAVADTEGGRTLHLKNDFAFDVVMMDPPHRPSRYADLAREAEQAGYDALVFDSFTAEWAGMGGVLSWADDEATRMAGNDEAKRERIKGATWIRPKSAHKAMVYSFLERRMPIIFSIRGEETFVPPNTKLFKAVCNKGFLFEVTVSFRLASERKGIIDLSDPASWKMEGPHRDIFRDGEQLSERHGEQLAAWASGGAAPKSRTEPSLAERVREAAEGGMSALQSFWATTLTAAQRKQLGATFLDEMKVVANQTEAGVVEDDVPFGDAPTAPDEAARDGDPFGLPPLKTEQVTLAGSAEPGNSNGAAGGHPVEPRGAEAAEAPDSAPRPRSEEWWSGERNFAFTKDRTADLYTVRQRIAEARDLAELGTLGGIHNKQLIEQLSRADQNEIADLFKARRGELAGERV